jgi:uncharacterized Zn finger protein (UPF0148 family)
VKHNDDRYALGQYIAAKPLYSHRRRLRFLAVLWRHAPTFKPKESVCVCSIAMEVHKELSQRMLDGWKMLSMHCPVEGCGTPLVESKKNGEIYCVKCKAVCMTEQQAKQAGKFLPADIGGNSSSNSDTKSEPEVVRDAPPVDLSDADAADDDLINSDEPLLTPEEWEQHRQKRDAASAKIGKYLMQSYTMLSAVCELCSTTPLLQAKGQTSSFCVLCSEENTGSTKQPVATTTGSTPVAAAAAAAPPKQRHEAVAEQQRKVYAQSAEPDAVDASALLAEKMLIGWAMLSSCCPAHGCNTPLMRDRQGLTHCVACGRKFSASGQELPSAAQTAAAAVAAAVVSPVVGQRAAFAAAAHSTNDSDDDDEYLRGFDTRATTATAATTAAATAAASSTVQVGSSSVAGKETSRCRKRIRESALDALYSKLDAAQASLAASECDTETARVAQLMQHLGAAVQAMQGMHA